MEERQKVWIRGNEDHPEKVIKTLENLGGYKTNIIGDCPNNAYFINHNGQIDAYDKSIEAGKIVIENYKEIKIYDTNNEYYIKRIQDATNEYYWNEKGLTVSVWYACSKKIMKYITELANKNSIHFNVIIDYDGDIVFNEFDKMLSDLNIIAEDIFPKK